MLPPDWNSWDLLYGLTPAITIYRRSRSLSGALRQFIIINRVRKKPTDCQNHHISLPTAWKTLPILLFSLNFTPWHEICIYQLESLNNGD